METRLQTACQSAIVCCLWMTAGCSTLPDGGGWGENATIAPGWERVRSAATDAVRDPWVWAPLAGAALFQVDDWDRRVSDWAREHTPVFGSQRSAQEWSDDLRNASVLAHYATVAATPSGSEPAAWIANKAKGTLVGIAAVSATVAATNATKDATDRERPNGDDSASFPSGHTSSSAVHTRLASRNLRSIQMSPGWRRTADVGLTALTVGTSWSRIEAGWHYPSDTLVGMALGNFIASFVNDAFLRLDTNGGFAVSTAADGVALQVQWRFQ